MDIYFPNIFLKALLCFHVIWKIAKTLQIEESLAIFQPQDAKFF